MMLAGALSSRAQSTAATFGDVVALGGTPADIVLDESRNRLYLVNSSANRIDIYDYKQKQLVTSVGVGTTPLAAAMSMDNAWLYVTNSASLSLSVIDLTHLSVGSSITLPSKPHGVAVGADGRALVSMVGTGVVTNVPIGTLAIFDRTQPTGQQLVTVSVPALPLTPTPLPGVVLSARPTTVFNGKMARTPDGNYIVGLQSPLNAPTYMFVYEVASGAILRSRSVAGSSTVLSMAPDGSRFMAGSTLYDINTLNVLGSFNNANAPFPLTPNFNLNTNLGGSVFAPDGSTLYGAFNTAATAIPAPRPVATTLLVSDPSNLAINLGIRLPESIIGKMVMTSTGSDAWAASESGILHLPLGQLYTYPIVQPSSSVVFLAVDDCHRGIAAAQIQVTNLGKGRLTFNAVSSSAALEINSSTGLAPATVTFSMDPGRSGVVRQPGTNIWTGNGTSSGTPLNISLTSNEAINIPNSIRVYMNYRQSDQRGVVYPLPTTPNNTNEGLQNVLLDQPRGLLYITNSGYNRVEVFNLATQSFGTPIAVGQLPHGMAMSPGGGTLYVGNTGGESISIVDLNQQLAVDRVQFPPFPRPGTSAATSPSALAMGQFGLQVVMSNGGLWKVSGDIATTRPADPVIQAATNNSVTLTGGAYSMLSTPDNRYIFALAGSGLGYLYDSYADAFTASGLLFPAPIRGYFGLLGAAPQGAFFLANGLILNTSMTIVGGSATPSTTPTADGSARNIAAVTALNQNQLIRLTTPVRQAITSSTVDDARMQVEVLDLNAGSDTLAGVAPENPLNNVFGTARINVQPQQLVADSQGNAYAITLSGLSVISTTPASSLAGPQISGGVANANDGTANIQPGSFVTVTGSNLASTGVAGTIPPPTVLGGSCVTFNDIAVPLLQTSSGMIQAQVPQDMIPGMFVVAVRSLATAQDSDPVVVQVQRSVGR